MGRPFKVIELRSGVAMEMPLSVHVALSLIEVKLQLHNFLYMHNMLIEAVSLKGFSLMQSTLMHRSIFM